MENVLTLGKLLSLWFCFLLHSILFLISQTSYHIYKIISSNELARPVMGTIFLVYFLHWRIKGLVHVVLPGPPSADSAHLECLNLSLGHFP